MPCGRMSIASRSRSWDLRASAIAASASARLRTISPISVATCLLPPDSFGLGLPGCRGRCAVGRRLIFLWLFGRIFGIARPARFRGHFSDKCLKNWCFAIFPDPVNYSRLPVYRANLRQPCAVVYTRGGNREFRRQNPLAPNREFLSERAIAQRMRELGAFRINYASIRDGVIDRLRSRASVAA